MKKFIAGLAGLACLCLSMGFVLAEDQAPAAPDATIQLSGGGVAAGIGFSWGSGTLTYQGREYPLSVSGLSVADVGITRVSASGQVFHLRRPEDINGNYVAAAAGAAVGGGAGATTMQNQNGVVIRLVSTTQGIRFTLAPAGVSIQLRQ